MKKFQSHSFFLILLLVVFLPYLFYGFHYIPILDDYIQYGCYPLYKPVSYVYTTIGTLATRPFSSLLDPVFWGQFRSFFGAALLLVTLLHVASAYFLDQTAKSFHLTLSPLFFLLFLACPLGMEGRYWLSASTRIITGLFFASLSLFMLSRFLQKKQTVSRFFLFTLFQILSFGFYESVAVFSALCAIFLFIFSFCKSRNKALLFAPAITIINLFFCVLYYYIFRDLGKMGSRAGSFFLTNFFPNLRRVLQQIGEVFSHSSSLKGSLWGIRLLLSKGFWGIIVFLMILFLSFVLCKLIPQEKKPSKQKILCLFGCGFLLFFAPLLPHAMTATVWITNRSLFVPTLGFALILEGFMALFHKKQLKKILVFLTAFVFLTANINEYDVYLRAGKLDEIILEKIIVELDEDVLYGKKNLQIVLPEKVMVTQNAYYKDHVSSVFDSSWALTGALRAKTKSLAIKHAEPLLKGEKTDKNAQVIVIEFAADSVLLSP